MENKELMINDLVNQAQCSDATNPYRCHGWKAVKVDKLPFDDEISISPIILTNENISLNIPFNRYWDESPRQPEGSVTEYRLDMPGAIVFVYDFRDNNGFKVDIDADNGHKEIRSFRVHYVHELQHLFRLFGLNDLADNFELK